MKYLSRLGGVLTTTPESGPGTTPEGQFDWGGFLPNDNGGARRQAQCGQQSHVERKGRSLPDCETDRSSRRESGA